jgi:hypothetical protein
MCYLSLATTITFPLSYILILTTAEAPFYDFKTSPDFPNQTVYPIESPTMTYPVGNISIVVG